MADPGDDPSGTVLVRRRGLGDLVLVGAITAGGALPRPVSVITEARYVGLASRLIGVDRAIAWGEPVPPGRVVDLQRDLRTLWAFPRPDTPRIHKHSARRWLRVALGIGVRRPPVPSLYGRAAGVAPVAPPWIRVRPGPRRGAALIPASASPVKQWAPDAFVAVGRALAADGAPVWVVGGPGDVDVVAAIAGQVPGARAVHAPGFDGAIDVFASCATAVGGDTGLLHLAAACGAVPVVVFGPTHPDDGFFPYPDGVALGLDLPCRPCARHRVDRCKVGHHGCMGVDWRRVVDAVRAANVRATRAR